MQYYKIPVTRSVKSIVIIRAAHPKKITSEVISEAIAATIDPDEWDVASEKYGPPTPISEDAAIEFKCHDSNPRRTTRRPTLTGRALEIGISRQTLSNWEKDGVAVFDDDAISRKLGPLRHLPQVASRFYRSSNSRTVIQQTPD
jgi:hypothetical protein